MTLEHFRHDPIGIHLFAVVDQANVVNPDKSVQANYINYSIRAFYLTMSDIQEFEFSTGEIVPLGRYSIVASTYWFLALESYITTLLKLTCIHVKQSFKSFRNKKAAERLTVLLELLKVDATLVMKSGLHSRINEFTTFRNEIFHDRNFGEPVNFQKTLFSPFPIQCNTIDVLQGLIIFMETAYLLRYIISGIDSMPDIAINVQNKVFFKKLDILYHEIIKPSFQEVLSKHNLNTNLNIGIEFPDALKSNVFVNKDAAVYIVSDSPQDYKFQLNPEKTNICDSYLMRIVDAEEISPSQFRMGRYTIN